MIFHKFFKLEIKGIRLLQFIKFLSAKYTSLDRLETIWKLKILESN